jgi:23S rRNA (adenine2030-N6)-methyltransferase
VLSYQHAYHAGNFADVLKHGTLCWVLDYLLQKDKAFYFHDTHAGRGLYSLDSLEAQKTGEHQDGIARVWQQPDIPSVLLPYINTLKTFNAGVNGQGTEDKLRRYAGSPLLAHRLLRRVDRLCCTELHPQEFTALRQATNNKRNMRILRTDGYEALKAALPPVERRGVILIDPSYELPGDDAAVILSLREGLLRFPEGIFLLWYPLVQPARSRDLINKAQKLVNQNLLLLELSVASATEQGYVRQGKRRGMYGTGMLLVNPPWQLDMLMAEALPWLVQKLAPDTGSSRVEWLRGAV